MQGIQRHCFDGDMEAAPTLAGQSAGLIDGVKTVQQIIGDPLAGFFEITGRLGGLASGRHLG